MTTEPSEQEMLVAACEKLGWRKLPNALRVRVAMGYDNYFWRDPSNVAQKYPADLLHSLDAHFAPGGTVEWMNARGLTLHLYQQKDGWIALFDNPDEDGDLDSRDAGPAMAILKAFLKYAD